MWRVSGDFTQGEDGAIELGVCDLYIGVDGTTERSGQYTSRGGESDVMDAVPLFCFFFIPVSSTNKLFFRCLPLGAFLAIRDRSHSVLFSLHPKQWNIPTPVGDKLLFHNTFTFNPFIGLDYCFCKKY